MDDLSPLGRTGKRYVALAKTAAAMVGVVVPVIIGAITAYRAAAAEAQLRVQATKDKAEAGYQLFLKDAEAKETRIRELEATVRQLAAQQHPPARRGSRPRPISPPPPPAAPKALPTDLDKAQKQIYQGGGGAAAPAPRDASP